MDGVSESVPVRATQVFILKEYDRNYTPPLPFRKYEEWSKRLGEIGRIIGGLLKIAK